MNSIDTGQFVNILIKMADAMMSCGAEVYRTEDTLNRIATAYGAEETDVFAITSTIVITVKMPGEEAFTQSRRLKTSGSNDFERLERLNALSRRVCREHTELTEFEALIDAINAETENRRLIMLGSMLAASCFALFYGGTAADGAAVAIIGLFIYAMQVYLSPICLNRLFFQLAASFATGIAACIAACIIPGTHLDKLMIGGIMLLIPGVMFTNSIRDMLLCDTLSGILRLIEAVLLALLLTLGMLAAVMLMNYLW